MVQIPSYHLTLKFLPDIAAKAKEDFHILRRQRRGSEGFPNVYASRQAALNKRSMERDGGVRKTQKYFLRRM